MISSGMQCYHLGLMLSSGTKCYHQGCNVIIWSQCYQLGRNVIIWDEMLSSGMKCYHLELMLSSGKKCYHLGWTVIIWDEMFKFNILFSFLHFIYYKNYIYHQLYRGITIKFFITNKAMTTSIQKVTRQCLFFSWIANRYYLTTFE